MSETGADAAAIERFATLLEETGTGRHHRRPDDADPELLALVGLTHRLSARSAPRPTFREELRARLMEAFHDSLAAPAPATSSTAAMATPATSGAATSPRDDQPAAVVWPVNGARGAVAPRPRQGADDIVPGRAAAEPAAASRPPRDLSLSNAKTQVVRVVRQRLGTRARLAAIVGVAVGALAISGVSMASDGALPGDALYPVKSLEERAQLWFAGSDADRGHLHLDFARVRLVEARQVGPEAVGDVLATMDRETTEGVRLLFTAGMASMGAPAIDAVTDFVQQQRADLMRLRSDVPAADAAVRHSLELLAAIEIRADQLRAALADGCVAAEADQLGPNPTC